MPSDIRYFAINLPDSSSRRESILQQGKSAGISIHLIPAIDGRKEKPDTTGHRIKIGSWDWRGFELSGPQLGCILSHRNALQRFLSDTQSPYCLVLEDDAQFDPHLKPRLAELTELEGWDLIKVENRYKKKRGFPVATTSWGAELIAGTKSDIGTTGLFWTREGAAKCLKSLQTLCLPFDVHLAHYRASSIRILDIFPPLITQSEVPSTIEDVTEKRPRPSYRKRSLRKTLGQSAWSLYRSFRAYSTKHRVKTSQRPTTILK